MELLAAAPGFGPSVPTGQNPTIGSIVVPPWTYEYAWPIDCIAARFVPWNNSTPQGATPANNTSVPDVPQTTFTEPFQSPWTLMPARMLVASDTNYPLSIPPDTPPSQWWNTRGVAPDMRTVILTDVPCAELVYTKFVPYPNLWDPLFQEAMCALLATYLALPCNPDKKEGRALRNEQIMIAKNAIGTARMRDGNEGTNSLSHLSEWTMARNQGAGYGGLGGNWGGGPGVLGYGFSSVTFADGSAY